MAATRLGAFVRRAGRAARLTTFFFFFAFTRLGLRRFLNRIAGRLVRLAFRRLPTRLVARRRFLERARLVFFRRRVAFFLVDFLRWCTTRFFLRWCSTRRFL